MTGPDELDERLSDLDAWHKAMGLPAEARAELIDRFKANAFTDPRLTDPDAPPST